MVYSCKYKSSKVKEKCLMKGGRYPITKNGKISKKRIRAAESYGSQMGVLGRLKKSGLCSIAKRKGVKLKACGRKTK